MSFCRSCEETLKRGYVPNTFQVQTDNLNLHVLVSMVLLLWTCLQKETIFCQVTFISGLNNIGSRPNVNQSLVRRGEAKC